MVIFLSTEKYFHAPAKICETATTHRIRSVQRIEVFGTHLSHRVNETERTKTDTPHK